MSDLNPLSQNLADYPEEDRQKILKIIEADQAQREKVMEQIAQTFDRPAVVIGAVGTSGGMSLSVP